MKLLYTIIGTLGMACLTTGELISVSNDYIAGTGFFAKEEKLQDLEKEDRRIDVEPLPVVEYRDTCLADTVFLKKEVVVHTSVFKDSIYTDSIFVVGHSAYTDTTQRTIRINIWNHNPKVELGDKHLIVKLPDTCAIQIKAIK